MGGRNGGAECAATGRNPVTLGNTGRAGWAVEAIRLIPAMPAQDDAQ